MLINAYCQKFENKTREIIYEHLFINLWNYGQQSTPTFGHTDYESRNKSMNAN